MTDRVQPDTTSSVEGTETAGRRRFLTSVGALATVLISGCSGDGDSAVDERGANSSASNGTQTPDQDEDESTTQGSESDDDTTAESDPDLSALERRINEFLTLQTYEFFEAAHDRLTASTAAEFPVEEMQQIWRDIVTTNGEFVGISDSSYQETTDGVDIVSVDTLFEANIVTFRVALGDDGIDTFEITGGSRYSWEQPAYADTSAFDESTVTLAAPGSCELGGTLSVPAGEDPVPGVVIVHGSGPSDRDGTQGPSKPYKELAWGLASRGVAVLRYDKRSFACDVSPADLTIDDVTTDDALTALDRLRAHDRVAPDSTVLVGHSQGGALAPRIAARDGNLAGAVLLAPGPARPMADVLLEQNRHLLAQRPLSGPQREQLLADVEQELEKIRSLDIGDDEIVAGLAGREYFQTLAAYDGPQTAAELSVPLFLAQGERDYQVTPDGDFALWEEALGGEPDVRLERYEGLNHNFQQGTGPSTPAEYYDSEAMVARRVVEDIAGFVGRVD